jgi:hypothetical protein
MPTFTEKTVIRVCIVIIVALALTAGYYQATTENWQLNQKRILQHLGAKNTKDIINSQWERK